MTSDPDDSPRGDAFAPGDADSAITSEAGPGARQESLAVELRALVVVAAPVALVQLGAKLLGLVDTAVVGRLGQSALAGVGLADGVYFLTMLFGLGVMLGLDPLMAQAIGADRPRDARRWFRQGVWIALLLGPLLIGLAALIGANLELFGVEPGVCGEARRYLHARMFAIIPTLLYFATIYFMVDIEADKDGIKRLDKHTLPRAMAVLKHGWHQLLTLAVLVGLLAYGYSPMMSAFWAIVTLIALSFRDPLTRMSPVDLLAALESGVRSAMPVTVACGCAGIIIGSIFVSGLGLKFTNQVINIADGNLLILMALTGVAAIILGMGMTTTAVYITVAALIVPSLIQMDVTPMAAHMFAFYFGVVSTITPPVALASFAAAAIAGSRPMETAVESARIGIAKYLVPFAFVYNPALLFEGPIWLTILSGILAFISLWGLSVVLEGWFRGRISPVTRGGLIVLSLMALMPPMDDVIPGIPGFILPVLGAAGIVLFTFARQKMPETAR